MKSKSVKGALTVLRTCMGLKKDEELLVICDPPAHEQASHLQSAAEILGIDVVIEQIGNKVTREPIAKVSDLMKEKDATILCVEERKTLLLGHSNARREACLHGARIGFLTQPLYSVPSSKDLLKIRARSSRMATKLAKAREVKIISGRSNELRLILSRKRKPIALSSIIRKRGEWGALPDYAEATIAPLEDCSNGSLTVDSVIGLGKPRAPLEISFENGRIVPIAAGSFARRLDEMESRDQGSSILCELGVGTNHIFMTRCFMSCYYCIVLFCELLDFQVKII